MNAVAVSISKAATDLQKEVAAAQALQDKTITDAVQKVGKAWCSVAASIYKFGQEYDDATMKAHLESMGLKVTDKANKWTAAAKLAWAVKDGKEWTVSDQQANKYSKVCSAMEAENVKAGQAQKFLEDKTLTDMVERGRSLSFALGFGDEDSAPAQQINKAEAAEEQLRSKRNEVFKAATVSDTDVSLSVNLEEAGVDAGKHALLVEVDKNGQVQIIGFAKDSEKQVAAMLKKTYKAPPKVRAPKAPRMPHMMKPVLDAIKTVSVPVLDKKTMGIVVINSATGMIVRAFEMDSKAPSIVETATEKNEQMPECTLFLHPGNMSLLKEAFSNLRSYTWKVEGTNIVIGQGDMDGKAIVAAINKKRKDAAEKKGNKWTRSGLDKAAEKIGIVIDCSAPAGGLPSIRDNVRWIETVELAAEQRDELLGKLEVKGFAGKFISLLQKDGHLGWAGKKFSTKYPEETKDEILFTTKKAVAGLTPDALYCNGFHTGEIKGTLALMQKMHSADAVSLAMSGQSIKVSDGTITIQLPNRDILTDLPSPDNITWK